MNLEEEYGFKPKEDKKLCGVCPLCGWTQYTRSNTKVKCHKCERVYRLYPKRGMANCRWKR